MSDFNNAWATLVREILADGESLIIGDPDDQHLIIGLPGMITLKNNAIKQIEAYEIHPDYPFKAIQQYADQFTYEWQKDNKDRFDYTYFGRLTNYGGENYEMIDDQLIDLRFNLQSQIYHNMSSNRNHAITWSPKIDSGAAAPPCLQSINIKYVNNNKVDVFLYWRSRDAYTAWQSNLIAIVQMLNKYVIQPNKCQIRQLVEFCNNYHIYKSDIDAAEKKSYLSPQINYR